jgi:hypothetical protein
VLLSTASLAQPIPPTPRPLPPPADLTSVKGLGNADGTPLRLQQKWDGELTFEIAPMGQYVEGIAGQDGRSVSVQINARPLIRDALAEWTAAGLPLRAVSPGETPSLRIGYGTLALPSALGWTNVRGPVHEVTLSLRNIARKAVRLYGDMTRQGVIDSRQVSLNDFAAMLTSLTALHEIGHGLGLLHPDAPSGDELGARIVTLLGAIQHPLQPSIMIGDSQVFFTLAHQALGRPVGPGDIRLNQRDRIGARIMWNRNAAHLLILRQMQCALPSPSCIASQ